MVGRGWGCLGLLFVCPRHPALPPDLRKLDVFALAPRSQCKNVEFSPVRRNRGVPGADKKEPKTAPTTGQRVDGSTGQRATGPRNRARWPVRGRSPCQIIIIVNKMMDENIEKLGVPDPNQGVPVAGLETVHRSWAADCAMLCLLACVL